MRNTQTLYQFIGRHAKPRLHAPGKRARRDRRRMRQFIERDLSVKILRNETFGLLYSRIGDT